MQLNSENSCDTKPLVAESIFTFLSSIDSERNLLSILMMQLFFFVLELNTFRNMNHHYWWIFMIYLIECSGVWEFSSKIAPNMWLHLNESICCELFTQWVLLASNLHSGLPNSFTYFLKKPLHGQRGYIIPLISSIKRWNFRDCGNTLLDNVLDC